MTEGQIVQMLFDYGAKAVVVCSILHTFLPPWENFEDWPTIQRYYKLLIFLIGFVALNARSTIYANKISLESQVSNGVSHAISRKKVEEAIAEQKVDEPKTKGDK